MCRKVSLRMAPVLSSRSATDCMDKTDKGKIWRVCDGA